MGEEQDVPGRSRRQLPAREREHQREPAGEDKTTLTDSEDDQDELSSAPASTAQSSSKPKPLPRGKRGKLKKIATKYADQDESDRALALRLLGHSRDTSQTGQEASSQSAAAQAAARTAAVQAQQQRRREQHTRQQEAGLAAEEARRAMHDQGAEVLDESEPTQAVDLDVLIGTPLPGDEILAALPVCAPWTALASYKYKIKLQPGLTKKGKALKEMLGRWDADARDKRKVDESATDTEKIWPREAECVRAWKDAEVVGVIPVAKMRTVMPGGREGGGGGNKGKTKSGRGGKGSKKQR